MCQICLAICCYKWSFTEAQPQQFGYTLSITVSLLQRQIGTQLDSCVRLYGSQSLMCSLFGPFEKKNKKQKTLSSVPVRYNQVKRTKIIYNLFISSVLIGRRASLSWINIFIKYNWNTIIYFFICNKKSNCSFCFYCPNSIILLFITANIYFCIIWANYFKIKDSRKILQQWKKCQ